MQETKWYTSQADGELILDPGLTALSELKKLLTSRLEGTMPYLTSLSLSFLVYQTRIKTLSTLLIYLRLL